MARWQRCISASRGSGSSGAVAGGGESVWWRKAAASAAQKKEKAKSALINAAAASTARSMVKGIRKCWHQSALRQQLASAASRGGAAAPGTNQLAAIRRASENRRWRQRRG
jgi:hypothetical protein